MELVKTLKPSFKFPNFTIRYKLELLPFEVAGFVGPVYEGKDSVLLSEQVTLTTRQISGLTTRCYAPPRYEKPITASQWGCWKMEIRDFYTTAIRSFPF